MVVNSIDSFIPEIWAMEALRLLEENIVVPMLVYTDYSSQVAREGETIHISKPSAFSVHRKTADDDVTTQAAVSTQVDVVLNQNPHVSFIMKDAEMSKSQSNLIEQFLRPAILEMARFYDKITLGTCAQFLGNRVGSLGTLAAANVKGRMLETRTKMNNNLAPEFGRNLIWTPNSEAVALELDAFLTADKVGDAGTKLREASLGRLLGFDNYMCQNATSTDASSVNYDNTGLINNSGGYAVGTTSLVVDGFSGGSKVGGGWITINGYPYRVVSTSDTTGNTTGISIASPGLAAAVANNDVVIYYTPAAVNNASGYDAGYAKTIAYDGATKKPVRGSIVSFGTSSTAALYTVIEATSTTVLLDRPLEAALSDDDKMHVAPEGDYNFAFCRDAIALVNRPLQLPPSGLGVNAGIAVLPSGLSIRVVISYDPVAQGVRVTLDALCGTKVLYQEQGAVLLG